MLIAVSILSPVSTQILTPTFLINLIVSGTLSYKRSSIAVDPMRSRFFSIRSLFYSSLASLLPIEIFASSAFIFHA